MFSTTVDDRERERRKGQELDGDPEPESMRPFIARSLGPLWLNRLCETGVRAVNPREGKAATFPRHMSIRGTELSRRRSLLLTGRVPITPDAPTRCLDCRSRSPHSHPRGCGMNGVRVSVLINSVHSPHWQKGLRVRGEYHVAFILG